MLPQTSDFSPSCFKTQSDTGIRELEGAVQEMKTLSRPHQMMMIGRSALLSDSRPQY